MPPRTVSLLIVAFWLAMSGWLFYRDIWPRLDPGEPPPLLPSFGDDAKRRLSTSTQWGAVRHAPNLPGQRFDLTTSAVYHNDDDTWELRARLRPRPGPEKGPFTFNLEELNSEYRVRRDGSVVNFSAYVKFPNVNKDPFDASFLGAVDGRVCNLNWTRNMPHAGKREGVEPFAVSRRGVVLLPLHPLYLMPHLRPGRSWGVPAFDPLTSAAPLTATSPAPSWVNARVRDQTHALDHHGTEVVCHVVDYEGDRIKGSTWVDAAGDFVLLMEVELDNVRWEITRK